MHAANCRGNTWKLAASAMVFKMTKVNVKLRLIQPFMSLGTHPLVIRFYGPSENEAFIHVPLEHPGSHQYGPRSSAKLRFYLMTMQFAFLVASRAMKIMDMPSGCPQSPSRQALIRGTRGALRPRFQSRSSIRHRQASFYWIFGPLFDKNVGMKLRKKN